MRVGFVLVVLAVSPAEFRAAQLAHPRVKIAHEEKGAIVQALFREKGLPFPPRGILIRVFKDEGTLELWGRGPDEVYLAAVEARGAGQEAIPVQIFPARLDEAGMARLAAGFHDPLLLSFWRNLRGGFDRFERRHRSPRVSIDSAGSYHFSD